MLGGWQLSGIGTWQSGTPLTVTAGVGQSPTGASANRADRIADGKRDHGGLSRGEKALQWFDTSAYRVPAFVNAGGDAPYAAIRNGRHRDGDRPEILYFRCDRAEELLSLKNTSRSSALRCSTLSMR